MICQGLYDETFSGVDRFVFTQLKSTFLEQARWVIRDAYIPRFRDFTMDPAQDLLVLVSYVCLFLKEYQG